jgi:excisionase family DNA binding protein
MSVPSKWLTARDAATYADVSIDTIYDAVHRKEIRHTRIGGRRVLKFLAEWIDEWLVSSSVAPRARD